MQKLMISLDNKILDKNSQVAMRMVEYGEKNKLYIIIPSNIKKSFDLSKTVHVESTGGNKIQQFFRLKKIGKKILKKEKIDLIISKDPFFTGLIGWKLKKKFKIKLEVQLHGDFFSSDYYKKQNLFKYRLGKFVVKRADKIRVVGERIKKSLLEMSIDSKKIVVKPIEVLKLYKLVADHKEKGDFRKDYKEFSKIFVWGGRMEPVKNLFWLINVFAEVVEKNSKYLLLLIGDGSQRNLLKALVKKKNLSKNVKFIPWVDSLVPYIRNADCVLFPSLSEGYGLVPMEACDTGVSIIMNDVGVAGFELKEKNNINIISVKDKKKWVEVINNI